MFENRKTNQGIHFSRYIASWKNAKGPDNRDLFRQWLETQNLKWDDILDILEMWSCGKMELEHDIEEFLSKKE